MSIVEDIAEKLNILYENDVKNLPEVDFSRVEPYVGTDGTRYLKNQGYGVDGVLESGQMLDFSQNSGGGSSNISMNLNVMDTQGTIRFSFLGSGSTADIMGGTSNFLIQLTNSGFRIRTVGGTLYSFTIPNYTVGKFYDGYITFDGTSIEAFVGADSLGTQVIDTPYAGLSLTYLGDGDAIISNVCFSDGVWTDTDIALDTSNPELIADVATNNGVSPFSFDNSNVQHWFALTEGVKGGGNVWDGKNGTLYSINNYVGTMWSNADNLEFGLQNTLLVKDDVDNFVLSSSSNVDLGLGVYSSLSTIQANAQGVIEVNSTLYRDGEFKGYTIQALMKSSDISTRNVNKLVFGYGTELGILISAGQENYLFYVDGGNRYTTANTPNEWELYTIAVDSNSIYTLYVGSTKVAEGKVSIDNITTKLSLGTSASTTENSDTSFVGARTYRRALTQFEVTERYNQLKDNATELSIGV